MTETIVEVTRRGERKRILKLMTLPQGGGGEGREEGGLFKSKACDGGAGGGGSLCEPFGQSPKGKAPPFAAPKPLAPLLSIRIRC